MLLCLSLLFCHPPVPSSLLLGPLAQVFFVVLRPLLPPLLQSVCLSVCQSEQTTSKRKSDEFELSYSHLHFALQNDHKPVEV